MRCGRRRLRRLSRPSSHAAATSHRGDVLLAAPASSYRISAYLEAARRLGVSLLVVSEGEHALLPAGSAGIRVDFEQAERAFEKVIDALHGHRPRAVLASDDATVEFASRLAASLGLPHNPPEAARISRRKDLARCVQRDAGLPVPDFRTIDLRRPVTPQIEGLPYPCVVKPLAMSGSRGVIRADDPLELHGVIERVRAIVAGCRHADERETLLVERFLPGVEAALEGMLDGGRLRVLALFDKPDPLDGPFFEETYYVTPSRLAPAVRDRVARRVAECCAAYGLVQGPVHAEVRVHEGEAWLLEVAARTIGGECARLLSFGTGCSLEELVLRQALGLDIAQTEMRGAAGVLMLPTPRAGVLRRVEGVMQAQALRGVDEVSIAVREGYRLEPLPEGNTYLGFVFASGDDPAEVEMTLRRAHAYLEVVIAPLFPVTAQPRV